MKSLLERFIAWLFKTTPPKSITEPQVTPQPMPEETPIETTTPALELYATAKASLGVDASPRDVASDEYACMESVDEIYKKTFGVYINKSVNRVTVSTAEGYKTMLIGSRFQKVQNPEPGCIIVSPTGYGNGSIDHGHIGIVGKFGIMSNSSETGKWSENYTLTSWNNYFKKQGGFPVLFFKPV